MMGKRQVIGLSMAAGMLWAVMMVWYGQAGVVEPLEVNHLALGFAPVGLLLAVMIGRLAQRRFFDDRIIDGQGFVQDTPAEIDQRVLTNTLEQAVLALCLWPVAGLVLGGNLLIVLGFSFVVARLFFWVGYHLSPPLRGVGFAATFYTTGVAGLWALAVSLMT